jgi:hypothetical protein
MLNFQDCLSLLIYEYKLLWNQLSIDPNDHTIQSTKQSIASQAVSIITPLTDNAEMMQYIELECLLRRFALIFTFHAA